MSDAEVQEARRLVRELLRSGQDPASVLRSVIDELNMPIRDMLRAVTDGRCDFKHQSTHDRGIEFVPSSGPVSSIPLAVRPATVLHAVHISWVEEVPIKTPLDKAQENAMDAAIRRRILGSHVSLIAPLTDTSPTINPDEFGGVSEYEYDSPGDE